MIFGGVRGWIDGDEYKVSTSQSGSSIYILDELHTPQRMNKMSVAPLLWLKLKTPRYLGSRLRGRDLIPIVMPKYEREPRKMKKLHTYLTLC